MSFWKINCHKFICDECHIEKLQEDYESLPNYPVNWITIGSKDYCYGCYEQRTEFKTK